MSFHLAMTASPSGTGGAGTKAVFGDLTLTRIFDSCSPRVLLIAATQQHVRRVIITELDKSSQPVLTILLDDVVVTSFQLDDTEAGSIAMEKFSLGYEKMTVTDLASNETVVISR
jgi:type VI protein secretion system component Hcp